jgi:anti-anti-sigma factor
MVEPGASDTPLPGQLVIDRTIEGDAVTLVVRGELDLTSAPVFERALLEAEASNPRRVIIDLSGLEFMDSTGLRALLIARERAQENGHELALRRGPRQVQRVLELTKTLDAFQFED